MPSKIQLPTIAVTALSTCLSLAIVGTAGHILHMYQSQRDYNPWWLPLWPEHFDDRGLKALVGASCSVVVLNLTIIICYTVSIKSARITSIGLSSLATVASLVEIIYPAVLNQQSPNRDTMQSWTCRWSSTTTPISAGVPSDFSKLCTENKFAFYATVPVFVLQLLVLGLIMWSFKSPQHQISASAPREKDISETSGHSSALGSRGSDSAH